MSQEYFSLSQSNLYTFRDERSDELGGLAEILLQEEIENVK